MAKTSAGILLYRRPSAGGEQATGAIEVLLVHPGGPFWARRDAGAWSIPKGEYVAGDEPFEVAVREFVEELGSVPPPGDGVPLGEVRQAGGKRVTAWAVEGDLDVTQVVSNEFETEWPPRSGVMRTFPEIDRAEWFDLDTARSKLVAAQAEFVDRLVDLVDPAG